MAESQHHIKLVDELASWISNTLLNGDNGLMLIDHPKSEMIGRPPKVGGYIPDIFVPRGINYNLIIGEAKTANDLEKSHSVKQIKEFILKCKEFENSIFILAVPWYLVPLARSIIRKIVVECNASSVEIKILEKLAA